MPLPSPSPASGTPSNSRLAKGAKRDRNNPRTVRFVLRFRPSEHEHLCALANDHGLALADLCRHRLLEWELPRPHQSALQAEFYGVLSSVSVGIRNAGNNLNQLAKIHHHGLPIDSEALVQSMTELKTSVDELRRYLAMMG